MIKVWSRAHDHVWLLNCEWFYSRLVVEHRSIWLDIAHTLVILWSDTELCIIFQLFSVDTLNFVLHLSNRHCLWRLALLIRITLLNRRFIYHFTTQQAFLWNMTDSWHVGCQSSIQHASLLVIEEIIILITTCWISANIMWTSEISSIVLRFRKICNIKKTLILVHVDPLLLLLLWLRCHTHPMCGDVFTNFGDWVINVAFLFSLFFHSQWGFFLLHWITPL